jgi:Skp family chaperone for outer membrane proteins
MSKFIKWLTIANTLLIAAVAVVVLMQHVHREKNSYVNLGSLFNGFKYKAVADKEYETKLNGRKALLDSLEIAIIAAQNQNDTARVRKLGIIYYQKQDAFDKESENMSKDMTAKVWGQLTQYLTDYSKENDLTYLYGSKGDGNLMYAIETKDVTAEALEYVNKRYEDEK